MKKIILVGVITFVIGAIISPIAGMAINSTRSLILGMAPDEAILVLADKIDEESGKNDEQEQKLAELNNAATQQDEEMAVLQKNQEIAACQKRKESCENKLYELENGEINIYHSGHLMKGSRLEMIKKKEALIANRENTLDEMRKADGYDKDHKKQFEDDIVTAKKEIEEIKAVIASETIEKNNLLNGECKDYQNPCE